MEDKIKIGDDNKSQGIDAPNVNSIQKDEKVKFSDGS